jgi:hypothetical protein
VETYVKVCPGCKTATALQAICCHACGHVYRTRFDPATGQVEARITSPPVPARPQPVSPGRRGLVAYEVGAVIEAVPGRPSWQRFRVYPDYEAARQTMLLAEIGLLENPHGDKIQFEVREVEFGLLASFFVRLQWAFRGA